MKWTVQLAVAAMTTAGCSMESGSRNAAAPTPRLTSSQPSPTGYGMWVMAVDGSGVCIVPATIEASGGLGLERSGVQSNPCSVWDYSGGVMFMGLPKGEAITLRASAPGYVAHESSVVPGTSGQVVAIELEPLRQP
jgi:hypothetical protein